MMQPYSLLITKGMGLNPACCGLITNKFSLTTRCNIEIIVPPDVVGGGSFVSPQFLVPFPNNLKKCDRIVLITVKITDTHTWRKQFVVDVCNTDKFVKLGNLVNSVSSNISIGIENLKQLKATVVAKFK